MYALNLEQAVECYLEHKISLGLRFRQESWLLRHILKQIVKDGRSDLDAIAYTTTASGIGMPIRGVSGSRSSTTFASIGGVVIPLPLYRKPKDLPGGGHTSRP